MLDAGFPWSPESEITVYINGQGILDSHPADGSETAASISPTFPVQAFVDGIQAKVRTSLMSPGWIGICEVHLEVPFPSALNLLQRASIRSSSQPVVSRGGRLPSSPTDFGLNRKKLPLFVFQPGLRTGRTE